MTGAEVPASREAVRGAQVGRDGVLVLREHEGGDIPDYHEAIWLGDTVVRDARGRSHRHAGTRFAVVICNNPGCKFHVLINAELVAAVAADA